MLYDNSALITYEPQKGGLITMNISEAISSIGVVPVIKLNHPV